MAPHTTPPGNCPTKISEEAHLIPLTYYPPATQRVFQANARAIANKPYAKFFKEELFIYSDIPQYIRQPLPVHGILPLDAARTLLEPGHTEYENGWCELSDGSAYVASRTRFPGATGDMIRWWFWWHSAENERYALWFPYDHQSLQTSYADRLTRNDLSDTQKWVGSQHVVNEFIGEKAMKIRICFVNPAVYGLPWEDLQAAGYEAAVCAELWHPTLPIKTGDMLHLWRRVEDGLELRSRYWMATGMKLALPGNLSIPLDYVLGVLGIKRNLVGERIAYEHFIHDQTEFTNLASFLPALYNEYLAGKV
ncbi:hypothetical protein SEUCBS140593_009662 [Sporothrix eucalyptigena]|uniref:DAPG hydrolase PhiG domain-containing protein n=1 Tax=Sporothrix eucalyptigena TaxID=1812306 RepID=A0ABP0CZF1_9PEZI